MDLSREQESRKEFRNLKIRLLTLIGIGILVIAVVLSNKQRNTISNTELKKLKIGETVILIETAKLPDEKRLGLSGRKILKENQGVLFVFENNTQPIFWMKGMLIPLDIIWINDGKVVYIHENVPAPQEDTTEAQLPLYRPTTVIDYVLEVNAGFIQRRGIKVGDDVDLSQI